MPTGIGTRSMHRTLCIAVVPLLALVHATGASAAADQKEEPRTEVTAGQQPGLTVSTSETKGYRVLWPGHRIVDGTVESIYGDFIKVNTGELLPRFLSAKEAVTKGLPTMKRGDRLQLAVNDHNIVVDYHLAGQEVWHRIIKGQLAQLLPVGQE